LNEYKLKNRISEDIAKLLEYLRKSIKKNIRIYIYLFNKKLSLEKDVHLHIHMHT